MSKSYRLGQDIFKLYHQIDLKSVLSVDRIELITGGVMMDDGRLVLCVCAIPHNSLLIYNTDGSEEDGILLQDMPSDVTAVNNSTVAVTLPLRKCIEMYDINNKHKLKSIPVPDLCYSITTINNNLVVGCEDRRLLMIDHQTGEVVHTIHTEFVPYRVHAAGDRIFYCDNYTLYCYSYTDDKVTTTTLPSRPKGITSLQDGSLYVLDSDGSVHYVSSDGQQYKQVTTKGLKSENSLSMISYDPNQQRLFIAHANTLTVLDQK